MASEFLGLSNDRTQILIVPIDDNQQRVATATPAAAVVPFTGFVVYTPLRCVYPCLFGSVLSMMRDEDISMLLLYLAHATTPNTIPTLVLVNGNSNDDNSYYWSSCRTEGLVMSFISNRLIHDTASQCLYATVQLALESFTMRPILDNNNTTTTPPTTTTTLLQWFDNIKRIHDDSIPNLAIMLEQQQPLHALRAPPLSNWYRALVAMYQRLYQRLITNRIDDDSNAPAPIANDNDESRTYHVPIFLMQLIDDFHADEMQS